MNPISRGFRNVFRSGIRSLAVIVIVGLAIGLGLTMLVAEHAVNNKIASVKSSIGNTVTISPAGFNPGAAANNALTTDDLAKVAKLAHVQSIDETLSDRLATTGSSLPSFGRGGNDNSNSKTTYTTSLKSPTTFNTNRNNSSGSGDSSQQRVFFGGGGGSQSLSDFSFPVSFVGTTDPTTIDNVAITISGGKTIDGAGDTKDALISEEMATKNSLKVGDTFKAYNVSLTVAGIFTSSNQSAQGTVVLPLATLQSLSGQSGVVTNAVATVDSIDNLSSATTSIKNTLGSNADVVSAEEQAESTTAPLNSVKSVAEFSLIGALVAGTIIILLMMVIIVRERKREIGIAKAIGSGNGRIVFEFMSEALTLTLAGAIIGLVLGVVAGQPVTKSLVSSETTSSAQSTMRGGTNASGDSRASRGSGMPGGFAGFGERFQNTGVGRSLDNIQAEIGWGILLDGLGAALLIAILGSLLATGLIVRVRPSTIMRAE